MLDDPVRSAPLPSTRSGVGVPLDLAGRVLVVEREVDGPFDDREELLEERGVAGREVVVPHAVRDVAGDVGVERALLDLVTDVVGVPRAVGPLAAAQPLERAARLGVAAADVEGHRRLDQVPRVGVAAGCPRDVAVRELVRGDRVDRLRDLRRRHDARELRGGQDEARLRFPHFAIEGETFSV